MGDKKQGRNLLLCRYCNKSFSLPDFPSHHHACALLQAPTSGPSFDRGKPISLTEEQREELEAMHSILDEDFEFIEPECMLRLTINTANTRILLLIRYTEDYPQAPPLLAVKRLDTNISKECAEQLLRHLKTEAEALSGNGSVFVFELYNIVRRYLEGLVIPQGNLHAEFMEQRQQRQKEDEQPAAQVAKKHFFGTLKLGHDEEAFEEQMKAEHERFLHEMKDSGGSSSTPDTNFRPTFSMDDEEDFEEDTESSDVEESKQQKRVPLSSDDLSESSTDASSMAAGDAHHVGYRRNHDAHEKQQCLVLHMLRLLCTKLQPYDPSAESQLHHELVHAGVLDKRSSFDADTFHKFFKENIRQATPTSSAFWSTRYAVDRAPAGSLRSYYLNYFEEIRKLGEGGFGKVMKVRNKLDMRIYAIKQIHLLPKKKDVEPKYNQRIKREVKVLSGLHHQHIVRYYNAWIEDTEVDETDEESSHPWHSDMFTFTHSEGLDFDEDSGESSDEGEENEDSGSDSLTSADVDASTYQSLAIPSPRRHGHHGGGPNGSRILYLQMEYCLPTTLRSAINKQVFHSNMEAAYRVLRQILEALKYIHSKGVVHRDLKPENIFFRSEPHSKAPFYHGDIKIGDFGLATGHLFCEHEKDAVALRQSPPPKDGHVIEYSAGVGTRTYCAPEQEKSRTYNEKVDIFSVGILFLEMIAGFYTEHERQHTLSAAREAGCMPSDLQARFPKEAEVINLCIHLDSAKRWSAQQLLEDGPLPKPPAEDDAVRQMINTVTKDRDSPHFKRLLGNLFGAPPVGIKDCISNLHRQRSNQQPLPSDGHLADDQALNMVTRICNQHGLLHIQCPTVVPLTSAMNEQDVALYLSRDGEVACLPSNTALLWARYLALPSNQHLNHIKRYGMQSKVSHGHMVEGSVVSLDLVAPWEFAPVPDVEMLEILAEILQSMPLHEPNKPILRVSHAQIAEDLLNLCGVPEHMRNTVAHAIDSLRCSAWSKVKQQLQAECDVDESMIRILRDVTQVKGRLEDPTSRQEVADKVLALFRKAGAAADILKRVEHAFRDLAELGELVAMLRLSIPVTLDLGCINDYNVYQCSSLIQAGIQNRSNFEVIARGGRYDAMLHRCRLQQRRLRQHVEGRALPALQELAACGVQLDITRLMNGSPAEKPRKGPVGCALEVIVCGLPTMCTKEYVKEAFSVAKSLRAHGLRVSILYGNTLPENSVKEYLKEQPAPWMLLIKGPGQMQLKSITQRTAKEVSHEHLGKVVFNMVRGLRERPGSGHHESNLESDDTEESRNDAGVQVILLLSTFRTTDINRRQCQSACERAFRACFRPPAFPNSYVLCCGLSYAEVRTAVNVFYELTPTSTESLRRQIQPLVDALRETAETHRLPYFFVYSYPDQRFEMVQVPGSVTRMESSINQRKRKKKPKDRHGPWDGDIT